MENFNEMVLAKTSIYQGTTGTNKNGDVALWLEILAGKSPNRQVQDGTVMKRQDVVPGKVYLFECKYQGWDDVYGDQYNYQMIKEVTDVLDIIKLKKELGTTEIFTAKRPDGFEEIYERQNDAVESAQTYRERKGQFHRVGASTVRDHSTARRVVQGTSVTGARKEQLDLTKDDLTAEVGPEKALNANEKQPGSDDTNAKSGRQGRQDSTNKL